MSFKNTEELEKLIEPVVNRLGYDLVDIKLDNSDGQWTLRVDIDHEAGIGLDDCETVSKEVDELLDVHDPIPHSYMLEISSPGAERPLKKKKDFINFAGKRVKVKTYMKLNGQKNFTGELLGLEQDNAVLTLDDGNKVNIPLEKIAKANLVLEL